MGGIESGRSLTISAVLSMEELAKIEEKGDASQEELEALAQDLSSKLLLTTWKGTRWEVISVSTADRCSVSSETHRLSSKVVGEVVEKVLNEPGLHKDVALNRAKVSS